MKQFKAFKLGDLTKAKDAVISDVTYLFKPDNMRFELPTDPEIYYTIDDVVKDDNMIVYYEDNLGFFVRANVEDLWELEQRDDTEDYVQEYYAEKARIAEKRRKDWLNKRNTYQEIRNNDPEDAKRFKDNPEKYFNKKSRRLKDTQNKEEHNEKKSKRKQAKETLNAIKNHYNF